MRILDFKIDGQRIEMVGDFSDLVPGSSGYLMARFEFSEEWTGCIKIASFFDMRGAEYAVMLRGDQCEIPKEVLPGRFFRVKLLGTKRDFQIPTNKIKVIQGA